MVLFKRVSDLRNYIDSQQKNAVATGFVPTMGALHEGHLSLVREARGNDQLCIVSIFVNPTQFNDPADFQKYPVTIERDIELLEGAGCDVLFLPSVSEVYPNGTQQNFTYELGYFETILEGYYRPGHFQGVCMVVHRLLEIVKPDHLYIGQKDYQQCMVIKKLISITGMEDSITTHISPTLREQSGLAMSSRNMRLSPEERITASAIYQVLSKIRESIKPGDVRDLKTAAVQYLSDRGFRVDYVEIADASTLHPVDTWDGRQQLVALAAAFLDKVRLIDNILLN